MPPADDEEKYTIGNYIESAFEVLTEEATLQWSGYPRCDEFYPVSNYDEDDVREFWKHLDDRTWPKDGWFKSGWRVFMNQPYRDAKILEDVERRELALTERLVNLAATCPESAIAQRPSRDEFLPDALEAEMRERTDFSLRGDYVSEVEEWKFIPTPSCKTKARAPFPASYIRPSHEYLEHDYRVTILKQDAEESTDQEDDIVHEVFAQVRISAGYLLKNWETKPLPPSACIFTASPAFVMPGTPRKNLNRDVVLLLRSRCPMCKTVLTHCPFPAHALFDPCRVHRHKKPSNGTAAGSSHEQAVIPNKKSTSNASADQGGPTTGPKKKPRRRGGKVRREELARKAKAKIPK
ncbi:hypothetical protein EXIGLDRAFT_696628 [Exidia glandulosa HHB12029]|uniref:Uncharacterized protein n=1 Tax=Exidia glandulosa HHB12029 TaxID=1314781 RepID=A0A165F7M3_EXIGL|nr:hypothetical protein EXIGLDRAFT_696628 [Exidia glandulosa HHB12029]